jgi:hypothetical protein
MRTSILVAMQKFTFDNEAQTIIRHNLVPYFRIEVIFNDEYACGASEVFEVFEFRGNKITFRVIWDDDLAMSSMPIEAYSVEHISSILRRAWKFYRAHVYIERKKYTPGPMEDENFILQKMSEDPDSWIVTDKKNLLSIVFKNGKFNETQKIVEYNNFDNDFISRLPSILRSISDWLYENHYDKVF